MKNWQLLCEPLITDPRLQLGSLLHLVRLPLSFYLLLLCDGLQLFALELDLHPIPILLWPFRASSSILMYVSPALFVRNVNLKTHRKGWTAYA